VTASRFFIAPSATASATAPTVDLYNGFTWVDTSVFPNITRYWNGASWVTTPLAFPFIVQATPITGTGTLANPQIPAGVYIDAAFIRNATITTAKIADLAVDNAKIANLAVDNAKIANLAVDNAKIANLNADKITAGFISADRIAANSIVADKIDTRGLSIKDSAGNIILAAGTALSVSNVSGLGTLATANSVDYSSVSGTKPPADADKTSLNTAAAIANQGNFATLNQITSSNISTYIASAAIGTAYIVDAAITNAKIGNFISSADFNGTINTSGNITDAGTTGWAIGKGNGTSGVAVFQNIVARGDIEVPEASISSAKISELAVDGLKIRGGAVTFTAIQELENTWPTTALADRQIGFIDFSEAAQDGALFKLYVLFTGTTSSAQLHSSRLEISVDNITWTTLATTATSTASDENGGTYTVPAPIVSISGATKRLAPTTYGGTPRNSWWSTSTRSRSLLNELAVWLAGSTGGTVTMQFIIFIPTAGTYKLYYCADDRVDSGNFGTPQSGTVSLSPYQFANDPQVLTYTTNGPNQIATLNVTCTDTGSLEGFAAYLVPTISEVPNSTANSIWTVRRPNYTTNVFKYARVIARRYNSFTNPNVTSWLGVEIIRK